MNKLLSMAPLIGEILARYPIIIVTAVIAIMGIYYKDKPIIVKGFPNMPGWFSILLIILLCAFSIYQYLQE